MKHIFGAKSVFISNDGRRRVKKRRCNRYYNLTKSKLDSSRNTGTTNASRTFLFRLTETVSIREEIIKRAREDKNKKFVIDRYTGGPSLTTHTWKSANQNSITSYARKRTCTTQKKTAHASITVNQHTYTMLCKVK